MYILLCIDVCDDIELSRICRSKAYTQLAIEHNTTAIISTGIWPGGSSLLAQQLITQINTKNKANLNTKSINKIIFSFFTAGSGGAGETRYHHHYHCVVKLKKYIIYHMYIYIYI